MAEQGTITPSNLPIAGANPQSAQVTTSMNAIFNEFNKQVPMTKLSAEQPWISYSSQWGCTSSPPSIGNGTITGAYVKLGRLIRGYVSLVAGSTTTFGTGQFRFSLPVTGAALIPGVAQRLGDGIAAVAGYVNGSVPIVSVAADTNSFGVNYIYSPAANPSYFINVTNVGPGGWAANDNLFVSFLYQSAT